MQKKSVLQVLLLSTFVLFLKAWAGAQSIPNGVTSSLHTDSSSAAPTEQQEMREELKALRAEVERLRAEVEQQKTGAAPAGAPSNDRSEAATAPAPAPERTGPGPNVPAVTAANFSSSTAV